MLARFSLGVMSEVGVWTSSLISNSSKSPMFGFGSAMDDLLDVELRSV